MWAQVHPKKKEDKEKKEKKEKKIYILLLSSSTFHDFAILSFLFAFLFSLLTYWLIYILMFSLATHCIYRISNYGFLISIASCLFFI